MEVKAIFTARRKPGFKGPFLTSVSIGNYDCKFTPGKKEYTNIPPVIAEHLKAHHGSEFSISKTKRRQK